MVRNLARNYRVNTGGGEDSHDHVLPVRGKRMEPIKIEGLILQLIR